jgi:hypothetical protein
MQAQAHDDTSWSSLPEELRLEILKGCRCSKEPRLVCKDFQRLATGHVTNLTLRGLHLSMTVPLTYVPPCFSNLLRLELNEVPAQRVADILGASRHLTRLKVLNFTFTFTRFD